MSPAADAKLRPWLLSDAAALVAAAQDGDVSRQLGDSLDLNSARTWIEQRVRDDRVSLAVTVGDIAVGDVTITIEPRHRNGWLSYWIDPRMRGQGLASRAAATLAAWAFEERSLFRLELGHRANNPASGRVAERAGFQREGLQRSKLEYDGKRFDVFAFARLATDPAPDIELLPVEV